MRSKQHIISLLSVLFIITFISHAALAQESDFQLRDAPKKEIINIDLHPNPTLDIIGMTAKKLQTITTVIIYNPIGQKIKRILHNGEEHLTINVSEFDSGAYIISFYTKNKLIVSEKFIKI